MRISGSSKKVKFFNAEAHQEFIESLKDGVVEVTMTFKDSTGKVIHRADLAGATTDALKGKDSDSENIRTWGKLPMPGGNKCQVQLLATFVGSSAKDQAAANVSVDQADALQAANAALADMAKGDGSE